VLSLEAVLADPAAALAGLDATVPGATPAPAAAATRIVAITSCPTGIAHTFMAAEGLQQGRKPWATPSAWKRKGRSARVRR
jgi:PTS system fructose-specific IIC component